MNRFNAGGGELLDLEFLQNEQGRRVAAFGYMAGFCGTALGLEAWCQQQLSPGVPYPSVKPYKNEGELVAYMKKRLAEASAKAGRSPSVMVMGALGRCGTGACDMAVKAGLSA